MAEHSFPDDPESLPEGSVVDGARADGDLEDAADYVVIGTGAGGATAAHTLATAGFSVILLEEGPWVRTREFGSDVFPALKRLFRELGTQVTVGRGPFPLLQGRCVGGGTTINSAIAWRAPEAVIDRWSEELGVGREVNARALEPHYDYIERVLNVRSVSDAALGNQSRMLGEAASRLGIVASRVKRYDGGCEASASCLTGCRSGRKQGMNITFVPQTLALGARIYVSTRALRVESRFGRARAVVARFASPGAGRLRVHARRGVIVAASAVQTPGLLRRSGVRARALGKHFQTQPGTSVTARFDRRIAMDVGATQGYNSTHFVDSDRFKIETLSLPSEVVAARIPRLGAGLMRSLVDYGQLLNWAVILRGEAEGSVRGVLGADRVFYAPTRLDMERMRKGLRTVCELMFAVGAREIFPSVHGMPTLRSPDELSLWDRASLDPNHYTMVSSHLFGGARLGRDPRASVVGSDFQVHGVRGLYVMDASVFPTNLGVNPQHTIMALSRLAATRAAERPLPPV
jgi:choline dehydrogenase-like flavoprotein